MKGQVKLLAILFFATVNVYSQTTEVEKNIFNVQTGILGVWVNDEFRISNEFVLRAEAGLAAGYYSGMYDKNKYVVAPSFSLEPKWYYNFAKRVEKGKVTKNNSANFLSLECNYLPDWFTISNIDDYNVADQVSIIPKWGMRRSIGESNFNYEIGLGLGYRYVFLKQYGFNDNDSKAVLDITLRLGYKF